MKRLFRTLALTAVTLASTALPANLCITYSNGFTTVIYTDPRADQATGTMDAGFDVDGQTILIFNVSSETINETINFAQAFGASVQFC